MLLIAVTGWGQDGDKQRAADAGFDCHLTKPVAVADLTRALSSIAASA
jgi:CheY-like chemotaxis protein